MTAKHTPGPWRVEGLLIKAIDHGRWFGIAKVGGSRLSIEGNMDNARLIAAAPDLLVALEAMVKAGSAQFEITGWPANFHNGALLNARAAIAKARGE
jgi:hypothetical protein